ncbi:MAG: C40 family peptidase [Desulfobacteraceae bacterium]|nr:C40 family peptidase [Desulfobacteraceae bacterium]
MIGTIISECRSYLGVPWKHQGRSRKGVDCVGFLLLALKESNIPMLEIRGYARTPDGVALKAIMDKQPSLERVSQPYKIGDIVLFRIRKEPQHVAILVDSNTSELGMIHSYNGGKKMVVEHDFADYWKQKVVSVYRLK